ncbi:ImmA/IrrE family metallo-endopeptidase [Arsenicicoccus bolidensis]|uniref:IrrE N-terminal-like domain-containing protein n=1 Tax=Arsenicicoccus bolidensis TaxID=229480 RepID=A0ABS9Q0E9_9MICO|nr:ImmA/IrrE family metallo-endopeptidase [Arsenicicoccus bolidensis]MCG7321351.1 hypothetical protein [Arsenicicoccus bolidensis]
MPTRAQQRRALQAADELLNDLDVDQESPVDVFDLLDQCGLWLTFTRLENLLGAAVRVGDGGVLLTTQRPAAVQRYTAAHELGHWVLDLDVDAVAVDGESEVFHPSTDREILAQVFAGQLLMPPPLVFAACERYGIVGSTTATGASVYQAARDMGTSYEAAARQLANLQIIGARDLDDLLRQRPKDIKTALALGHAPSGTVEVWTASRGDHDPIRVTAGDEVFVTLPENRTTGHRWLTDLELDARAHNRVTTEPEAFDPASPSAPVPLDELLASASTRSSSTRVAKALARVPGNAGHRRTMPSLPTGGSGSPFPEGAELAATKHEPASLLLLDDRYRAGWATIAPGQTRGVRQAIAGRADVRLPREVEPYCTGELLDPRTVPVGGTGLRLLAFKAGGEGDSTVRLSYTSATNPQADTLDRYTLDVHVEPDPATQRRRQVIEGSLADPDEAR